jgi:uncharacterized protein YcfJ
MKPTLALSMLLLPVAALAAPPQVVQDSVDYARVIASRPVYGPPVARQVCTPETVSRPAEHSAGGAILGGLTGALVGSRFGGGHGKDATTVAGAIGGAVIGDRIGAANGTETTTRERCDTVYEAGPPTGYEVTYEYQGQQGTVTLSHPPGDHVKLRRTVTVD